jgi:hypothetical protein
VRDCLCLLPPLLLMLAWRSGGVAGGTGDWFNLPIKVQYLFAMLRDRWQFFDLASTVLLVAVLFRAGRSPHTQFARTLAVGALILLAAFLLLPRIVFGSAYADMRLAPYLLAVALLAIGFGPVRHARVLNAVALFSVAFLLVRLAGTTASFAAADSAYDRELAAIAHIPEGARIAAFVGKTCDDPWRMTRLDHLPSLALVRRDAFVNDQWALAGAQLLTVRYPAAGAYQVDPSQFVTPNDCTRRGWKRIDDALGALPHEAFDHVWLIAPPRYDAGLLRGYRQVWRHGTSALYRRNAPPGQPLGRTDGR